MKKLHFLFLTFYFSLPFCVHAQSDDFGTWLELSAEKQFIKPVTIGVEGELRTEDCSKKVDRWSVGVNASYKVHKYLKLGISYNLLDGYSSEKLQRKDHFSDGEEKWESDWYRIDYNPSMTPADPDVASLTHFNTRYTSNYWKPRHRFCFEASTSIKVKKRVRISLRERYQYTFHAKQTIQRPYYKFAWNAMEEQWDCVLRTDKDNPKEEETTHTHILRSRLKAEWDKKHCLWSPFVSVEAQNKLNERMKLRKVRTAIGTGYKINRHHSVSAAYVFTNYFEDDTERTHSLSIGYCYKF